MAVTAREHEAQNGKKFTKVADFHEYEIRLTRRLQSNDDVLRRRALKEADKWLKVRMNPPDGALKSKSFVLWKGLFYALWMADKPLVQEQLAQRVSSFVNLPCPFRSMEFFKYGLNILCCEWFGIDQLRLDKFLMFVRRFLRNGLTVVKNARYAARLTQVFNAALSETVLNRELIAKRNCMGLTLHVTEIFLEELAKVSEGKLRPALLPAFLKPFAELLAYSDDARLTTCVKRNVFRYLLEQSDAGQEHQDKFRAWAQLGYPGGSINAMRKVEVDVAETEAEEVSNGERVLDPRAGNVDVVLPQIRFKPRQICRLLQEYRFADGTNSKSRKAIVSTMAMFEEMSRGSYPLGIKKVDLPKNDGNSTKLKQAVNRLVKFERKVQPKKRKREEPSAEVRTDAEELVPKVKKRKMENHEKETVAPEIIKVRKAKGTRIIKSIKKRARRVDREHSPPDYEFSFERGSGKWYVHNLQDGDDKVAPAAVFSESKWDETNDGNVKKRRSSPPRVIIQSVVVLKKPNGRRSLPSRAAKKVKIDLKLNRSQEIHEHVRKVKSSPGIPFDAAKRPLKPLLKTRFATPIDPFYTLKH